MTGSMKKMLTSQGVSAKARAERARLILKVVALLLLVVVPALFCVWSRVAMIQTGYEVTSLRKQLEGLIKEKNHLEIEIERLKSPARLQKVASNALNMRAPKAEEVVFVKREKISAWHNVRSLGR